MKTQQCPKCGSENISVYLGGQTGQYECKNCGYLGAMIIEEEK